MIKSPIILHVLLGIAMLCSFTVNAKDWELTSGPEGGTVNVLLPIGDYLLANLPNSVYRYDFNKGTWIPSNNGLTTNWRINYLFRVKQTVLASSISEGLFSSTDSGTTWHKTGIVDLDSFTHIGCPTVYDTLLYATASDNNIYYSADLGKNWVRILDNFTNKNGIRDPVRIGNYLVIAFSFLNSNDTTIGIYRTTFSNGAWEQTWTKTAKLFTRSSFFYYPPFVFVGTDDGVYRSADSGKTWIHMNSELSDHDCPTEFCASNGYIYFTTATSKIYHSNDSGITWSGTSLPTKYLSLGIATAGSKLFCNTLDDGVLVSTDYGTTWTDINTSLNQRPISDIEANSSHVYAVTELGRLFISNDRGESWRQIDQSLFANFDVRCLVMKGTKVFVGTSGGGIFRSCDGGTTWDSVNNFLTERDIVSISVCDSVIYAGSASNVFQSRDNGNCWISSKCGLKPYSYIRSVTRQGQYLFACADSIYRSSDNGATWSYSSNGISGVQTNAVTIGKYVVVGGENGVFRSADSGKSWESADFGLSYHWDVYKLKIIDGKLLAGTDNGSVFISSDSATLWDPLGTSILPKENAVGSFAVSDSFIYAGGKISGIWRLPYYTSPHAVNHVKVRSTSQQLLTITIFGRNVRQMRIAYSFSKPDFLSIKISDISGRVRYLIPRQNHPAGEFVLKLETSTLGPGYYVVSLNTSSTHESRVVIIP
jgi:photosystem II stability/assembly factor-like uncharacterized protein